MCQSDGAYAIQDTAKYICWGRTPSLVVQGIWNCAGGTLKAHEGNMRIHHLTGKLSKQIREELYTQWRGVGPETATRHTLLRTSAPFKLARGQISTLRFLCTPSFAARTTMNLSYRSSRKRVKSTLQIISSVICQKDPQFSRNLSLNSLPAC